MAQRQLRIYPHRNAGSVRPAASCRITLRELLPLIATAQRMNLIWLRDFLDDEVLVTADLNEVLQAFQSCRPSA